MKNNKPLTLSQQINFIQEIDKLKGVYRQSHIKTDNNRHENSAEHSWHIALTAHILSDYAETPIDINRVILMLLLHDIVEIDAGDTFAFASPAELNGQHDKELVAANRLFRLLPKNQAQYFKSLWLEFETLETPDAHFAKAMDCIVPLLQNMNNNGGSWRNHQVSYSQILERNRYLEIMAPKLWDYLLQQLDVAVVNGWIIKD